MNIYLKYILLIIAALMGIGLSVFFGIALYEKETNSIKVDFRNDVKDKAAAFEREILVNLEVLYSIKGLFDASDNVEPDEFQQIAQSILVRHKNIQALEWLPKIKYSERGTYVAKRRQEFPDFEIIEQNGTGGMLRASKREQYFPVYYVEPLSGNESEFGYDVASSAERLDTLEKSQDVGKPLVTSSLRLTQGISKQGFLIFMPVYEGQPATIKKRRERLRGFVLGVYKTGDLFTSSIQRTAAQGINLSLIDVTDPSVITTLYANKVMEVKGTELELESSFGYEKKLAEFGGRQWAVSASPTNGYIAERRTGLPYATAIFGALFAILISIYSFIIMRHSEIVERTVEERTKDLNDAKKKLEALSRTDGLTNIGNRRAFDEYLDAEWNRAIRERIPLSLMMIDIDHFKLFNDTYGHGAGDSCLKEVAHAMQKTFRRTSDLVARYGGEEFVIVLPNTEDASSLAEECRSNIVNLKISHAGSSTSEFLSVSIGVATIIPEMYSSISDFTSDADAALYKAKEAGRNKVIYGARLEMHDLASETEVEV